MAVDLAKVQVKRDADLRATLSEDGGVKRALARLEERSSGYGFGARRRLISDALRLTRSMAPDVADALNQCRETVGMQDVPIEVYVRAEPVFNAFCMKHPGGPLVIGLSSRLLEVFTPGELQFVIGHELGHAAYDHFGLPMPVTAIIEDMAGRMVSRPVSLELYLWARAAELSADRIGLLCTQDPESAASSFFKLASGIASDRIKSDLDAYASQVDSLASAPEARKQPHDDDDTLDCFATHPYSPVRVRALLAFSRSKLYQETTGKGPGEIDEDAMNEIIARDLDLMSTTYLQEKSPSADLMRKVLFNAGLLVANANKEVTDDEVESLRTLLGTDIVMDQTLAKDIEKAGDEFEKLAADAVEKIEMAERARLVAHLAIVAAADGNVDEMEHDEMQRIASVLKIDPIVVERTLAGAAHPMD